MMTVEEEPGVLVVLLALAVGLYLLVRLVEGPPPVDLPLAGVLAVQDQALLPAGSRRP